MALDRFTGSSAAKLADLNPLIDAINQLGVATADLRKAVDAARADHDALRAEISARRAENRLGALETYAQKNSARIDEMEVRYDGVVDEMATIADNLTTAVADLAATDKASGWKQWKEQQQEQRGKA